MTPIRHILLSNDDGIEAHGLKVLEEALARIPGFRVTVVAPHDQQSASSHALTLTKPLRILDAGQNRYAVTGTPTDTVLVAMEKILADDKPDLVLSGINHGPNMGQDVIYSGTVAAAMEGTMFGLPSYALSLAKWNPTDFSGAAEFLVEHLTTILEYPQPKATMLNINIPEGPREKIIGMRMARLGSRQYQNVIADKIDPHGKPYFWIGGSGPVWQRDEGTDFMACEEGYVSLTPLKVDITHYELHESMKSLEADFK